MKRIKQIIKKVLLVDEGPKPLFKRKKIEPIKTFEENGFTYCKFGNLNSDKTFYIINRSSHAGIFSYLSFVLNHLIIAKQKGFIPIVDMENFTNPYNELKEIDNSLNSWEYYFTQTSNFNLQQVYESKKVIFSRDDFNYKMQYRIHLEPKFRQFIGKEINFKKKYIDFVDNYFQKNDIVDKKILGVHFRGTSYKTSRGHIFPATIPQIKKYVDKVIAEENFDKIFICTEEKNYLDFFKREYKDKLLYIDSFRSDKNDAFLNYSRPNHRFLLGDESIKEALILSRCKSLLFVRSNIINAANFFSKKDQTLYEIFNGFNSRNQFLARFLWFIKKRLPKKYFGLKDELIISKN